MPPQSTRKGFTLIELIAYTALVSMFLVATLRTTLILFDSRSKTALIATSQQQIRFALDRITGAIRAANGINAGGSTFGADAGVLSLSMSTPALDPTLFSLSGERIRMQEGGNAPADLTSSGVTVDILRFTNLTAPGTNGTVKVTIHAAAPGNETDEDYRDDLTVEAAISLRQ